jgi:alpha/beta superfamily hydrolase
VFPVTFPIPHLFSARSYVDKHNADERYNIMRFIHKVPCPIFLAAGGLEVHPRLRDCATDAYKLVSSDRRNRLLVMPDADHGFPGKADELAAALDAWFLESAPIAALGEQAI